MKRYTNFREIAGDTNLALLRGIQFKPVGWAYAHKDGNPWEFIVAERYKREDPVRKGQLVVPGGGVEMAEHPYEAAIREAREEAGVRASFRQYIKPTFSVLKPREKAVSLLFRNGVVLVHYTDTGKAYNCLLADCTTSDEPQNMTESDARNPRFMGRDEALGRQSEFTPAVQTALDMIGSATNWGKVKGRDTLVREELGDVVLEVKEAELLQYLMSK